MKLLNLLTLSLILFAIAPAQTQQQPRTGTWEAPEFGEISEIAKHTKVYVYCEDMKIRQEIVNELKQEPALVVVGKLNDAQFIVNYLFQYTTLTRDRGVFGTSTKKSTFDGELRVSVGGSVDDQNRVHQRIVWSSSKDRGDLGKNPYKKATKAFLDDYRRARAAAR